MHSRMFSEFLCSLRAALHAAQACRYLIYSEANFEVFHPAGATHCTDGGEIWHGGGDLSPLLLWLPPNFQRPLAAKLCVRPQTF